jgi:formylglycine-generating enzyme required for sulfatase activity
VPGVGTAKPQKSGVSTALIAAIVGIVLAGGGLGAWYMLSLRSTSQNGNGGSPTPTATATATATASASVTPTPTPSPGSTPLVVKPELVSIPGGTIEIGRSEGATQEGPPHMVVVKSFAMDRTEVTNAEYAQFVNEMKHAPPGNWQGDRPFQGSEMLPVVNVSYQDAVEFAKWRSKRDGVTYRLPTEEEWEYAARGGDQGNMYPWGSAWVSGRAGVKDSGAVGPKPVGSYPEDKTRWGVLDMAGNVYEWTSTKASMYPGNQGMIGPGQKNWIIVRGAAFVTDYKQKNPTTFRDWFPPTTKEPVLGFRLVRVG